MNTDQRQTPRGQAPFFPAFATDSPRKYDEAKIARSDI
jgi:hypothetical protein